MDRSSSSAHNKDENPLAIHSSQLAKNLTREMDRLWRSADLSITGTVAAKTGMQLPAVQQWDGAGLNRQDLELRGSYPNKESDK